MTQCSRCGSATHPGQPFCAGCGSALAPAPQVVAARPRSGAPLITGLIAGAVVLVAALIAGAVVLVQGGGGDAPEAAVETSAVAAPESADAARTDASTPPSTPSATSSPTGTTREATRRTGPGVVTDLPAGLFCRDLLVQGYSYVASIDYWRANGQPNQMDADRNGIPCETVYPSSDVAAYWGTSGSTDLVPDLSAGVMSLPAGLLCRDVSARGFDYGDAVDYWMLTGVPDAMDADLNGIPCETVYSMAEVAQYWGY